MWNKLLPLRAEISSPLGLLLGPAQSGKLWTHQDVWQELMDAPCSCHHVPHFFLHGWWIRWIIRQHQPTVSFHCKDLSRKHQRLVSSTEEFHQDGELQISTERQWKELGCWIGTIACPKTKVLNALAEDSYHFISSVYVYMKFRWNLLIMNL